MQKVEANSAKSYAKLTPLIQFQDEVAAGTGELPSPLPSLIHSLSAILLFCGHDVYEACERSSDDDALANRSGDLAKSLDSLREFSTSVMSYHEQFRLVSPCAGLCVACCVVLCVLTYHRHHHATCSKYLKEQTLPKLDALQSEIKKHGKQMNKKIEKAGIKLKKCEEEAVAAMLAHQKICQEMVRPGAACVVCRVVCVVCRVCPKHFLSRVTENNSQPHHSRPLAHRVPSKGYAWSAFLINIEQG
jgi:hypothetical protein